MQDYPQHLFISYLLSTFSNPSFDWPSHYLVDLKADPYNLFYYVTKFFSLFFDIETSGKLFISSYIALVVLLVIKSSRSCGKDQAPPWGLLLLFPFSFSQIYFLGFTNYLISVPLLFLALLDLDRFVDSPLSITSFLRQLFYQLLLFVTHPFTVALFIGFGLAGSLFHLPDRTKFMKAFSPPVLLALFFFVWFLGSYEPMASGQATAWGLRWWPGEITLGFYMLMFTGMTWTNGVHWPATLIWGAIVSIFLVNWIRRRKTTAFPAKTATFFLLSLLGFAIMPFSFTYYQFFNARMALISYFFLAFAFSRITLGRGGAALIVGLAALLMVLSAQLQGNLSGETEEVMPLFAKMERNAAILPLMLDSSAGELDPVLFDEFHVHEPSYYHIFVGGGVNPDLFPNPLLPVQYKPGLELPVPTDLSPASLPPIASHYRYLLVRGAPPMYLRDLAHYYHFVGQSGAWSLFGSPIL